MEDFLFFPSARLPKDRAYFTHLPTQASKQVTVARHRRAIPSHTRPFVLHNPAVRIEYLGPRVKKTINFFFFLPPLILFLSLFFSFK